MDGWPWMHGECTVKHLTDVYNDSCCMCFHSTGYAPYQILRLHGVPQGPTPIPFLGSYLELKKMVRNALKFC